RCSSGVSETRGVVAATRRKTPWKGSDRMWQRVLSLAISTALASAAGASVSFSFADPVPGRQVTCVANGEGPGVGLITYDSTTPIVFYLDGSSEGLGSRTFTNVRLAMRLTLGAAGTFGGITTAAVAGTFTFTDADTGAVIVSAASSGGSFVRVTGTNAIQFS